MNLPKFTCCMSPPTEEHSQRDHGGPSPAKSRNGLTPILLAQRVTLCALLKTELVGDALQSTFSQLSDDDN